MCAQASLSPAVAAVVEAAAAASAASSRPPFMQWAHHVGPVVSMMGHPARAAQGGEAATRSTLAVRLGFKPINSVLHSLHSVSAIFCFVESMALLS